MPSRRRKKAAKAKQPSSGRETAKPKRWSQKVTRESDALDLERSIFAASDPRRIALSLKRSAERSKRRKSEPYRSAMSMLVFYINRAGRNLPRRQARVLEQAKDELRKVFGRTRPQNRI